MSGARMSPKDKDKPLKQQSASSKLFAFLNKLTLAGTEGYPPDTRQRLRVINIAAYLIAVVTLNYFALHIMFGVLHHWQLVIGNLILVPIALSVPFLHRYHDHAGILVLYAAEFVMMFFLISLIGRESGVQINYIGFAAGAFLGIDLRRIRLLIFIILSATVLSISAWFLFPMEKAAIDLPEGLIMNLYLNSLAGTVGIVAYVVYYAFKEVQKAKAETDRLLRNVLPDKIADRLKEQPDEIIADNCTEATVLFADLVGFTPLSRRLGAEKIVTLLNDIFSRFDKVAQELQVEKIKTIGDAYMVVAGLPEPQRDHADRIARLSLRMLDEIQKVAEQENIDATLRIGIDSGPVMAGVIGKTKFFYDVWGDTVNMASRLESHGTPGKIQISSAMKKQLSKSFVVEKRGRIDIKGADAKTTWYLISEKNEAGKNIS